MMFQKAFRSVLFLTRKYNFVLKNSLSPFSSLRLQPKVNKNYKHYANAFFATTAVFGFTAYVAYKKNTLCEAVEIIDDKELSLTSDPLYQEAICKSRDLLQRVKDEYGAPGMVVGVSINGKTVWSEGLGYADIENRVLCSADTVMRIASISKSITMAAVAKLWEQGKLDLDKPVQEYVPYFPTKIFDGKQVTITCRQLVSHLSGIRHYEKNLNVPAQKKVESKLWAWTRAGMTNLWHVSDLQVSDDKDKAKKNGKSEFDEKEYYIKEHYEDVKMALDMFKDDPLLVNPGSKYLYSTHGWTLISAIVEAASKEKFSIHITKLFKSLGMHTTYLDLNDTLIYHRSRNYIKSKKGYLINAPYVDNSYKWAGGGFLSTVGDLLQFGNAMLYSLQYKPVILNHNNGNKSFKNEQNIKNIDQNTYAVSDTSNKQILPGYLKSKTIEAMWTPIADSKDGVKYGMGWSVIPEAKECQFCDSKRFCVFHTGGAIGASSVLLILPQCGNEVNDLNQPFPPKGIIVTILTNLQAVSLSKPALKIAQIFENESKQIQQ